VGGKLPYVTHGPNAIPHDSRAALRQPSGLQIIFVLHGFINKVTLLLGASCTRVARVSGATLVKDLAHPKLASLQRHLSCVSTGVARHGGGS
jgi:hypothetical protein